MEVRPIRSEADYDSALLAIARYFEREPTPGTKAADRFDVLAALIGAYEDKQWPIEALDPIEAIQYRMEQAGFTQAGLARLLGSRSRASEIMNRRRPLTLDMAWKLHRVWNIPAESLLRPYRLAARRQNKRATGTRKSAGRV
jgi:HTH-type transcriptional regulator/antitoxin HigA